MPHQLDHIVFNTRFETDAAAQLFEGLGFQLTPRGFHPTLGSINHLMIFAQDYLELIGLPRGGDIVRQELIDSPTGINGLVFASKDARATRDDVVDRGFEAQQVQNFSRPLVVDGTEHEARFSAVRLALDSFAAGRVYFCQHHTPELIWRREWMTHPNGATGIAELTVASADPRATREHYARLGDIAGDFALTVADAAALTDRFGELARFGAERSERFAAVTVRTRTPQIAAERAAALDLPHAAGPGRAVVALPALDALIEFVA